MAKQRSWADRERLFNMRELVVAKPHRLLHRYRAGQRFRPEREPIAKTRVKALYNARVLVSDTEWRRMAGKEPMEAPAGDQAGGDQGGGDQGNSATQMTKQELIDALRELGLPCNQTENKATLAARLEGARQ